MGWSYLQSTGATGSNASSQTATLNSVAAGDLLVVVCASNNGNQSNPALSATDSASNTYSSVVSQSLSFGGIRYAVAILAATAATSANITVTVSTTLSTAIFVDFLEFSGSTGQTASNSNTATSGTPNSGSITFNGPTLVLCGCQTIISGETWTAGSGFTIDYHNNGSGCAFASEYNLSQSSPVTPGFTISSSAKYQAVGAAWNPIAGSPYGLGLGVLLPLKRRIHVEEWATRFG